MTRFSVYLTCCPLRSRHWQRQLFGQQAVVRSPHLGPSDRFRRRGGNSAAFGDGDRVDPHDAEYVIHLNL